MRREFYVWPGVKGGIIGDILPVKEFDSADPKAKKKMFKATELKDGDIVVTLDGIKKTIGHFYSEDALPIIIERMKRG